MSLNGRTAIVTGASSGIGRGIAMTLAEAGADVAVADVRRQPKQGQHYETDVSIPTDELIEVKSDSEAIFVETDVNSEAGIQALMDEVVDRFGGIDILVNNAGILIPGDSQEHSADEWNKVMNINLRGFFLTAKHAIPHLRESDQGRIINISSVTAKFGGAGPSYSASKAGIINLTRDLAQEVAADGITANTVLPGVIKTPMQDLNDEQTMRQQAEQTPMPRLGEPQDVGHAVRFFASSDAEWISGAQLIVDGGFLADGY